jgi:Putative porin
MSKRILKQTCCYKVVVPCVMLLAAATAVRGAQPSDPLLELLIKKGMLTEDEANKVRSEAEAIRTNAPSSLEAGSKWKISHAIKSIELFGDLRLRYEHRQANTPDGSRVELDRGRAAVRLGLRGDAFDDFYYGLRLDTASNPRSPWVTFGSSSGGVPYYGPYGKSTFGIDVGQVFLGWRPFSWVDLTVGKVANPLFTTPMVWDTDYNPEGAVERFKYRVGEAEFFATFGQFLYADANPNYASGGLGFNGLLGQQTDQPFQLVWQAGVNYQIRTNISAKVAGTLYHYLGVHTNVYPYFGDPFVGEGIFTGVGTAHPVNGASGYGTSSSFLGNSSVGFPNNQVGLNHLLIVEIPAEINFQFGPFNARVFGDFAYNLEGARRAEDAAAGYANYLALQSVGSTVTVKPFAPQRSDVKAYQGGFAIGSRNSLGLVYGTTCHKHAWEFRTYWQHVEQYALDPNLIDSDFFEGRGNLQGIYAALAYGFTDNVIGTFRYGYAWRINDVLGTGGSNLDVPQVNPIDHYNLLQFDLTMRF